MKTCSYLFTLLIALLLLSFNANGESNFYTGLWEYTIEIKVPGMSQSEMKKVQKCIRELNDVISLFKPDPSCSVSHVQATDSQISWRLYCKTIGGTYHGDAKIQGNEHTQEGSVDLQTVIPGMKNILHTSYVITGKNNGVCQ
jgi:hypothetical protein